MKICIRCNLEKDDTDFYSGKNQCKRCVSIIRQEHYVLNKDSIANQQRSYKSANKADIAIYKKKFYDLNKNAISSYQKEYKVLHRENLNTYAKGRYKTNPIVKISEIISATIRKALKSSKNGQSKSKYLPYTIQELKEHLEQQFEPWMTCDNHGKYDATNWIDNDSSTWTWQIDHIIPRSKLPYSSMTDDNFQKCWALENLRPLSAKQNITDGNRRK